MVIVIKESLTKTSGNYSIFKKFLYTTSSFLGGMMRNQLKREYVFKVTIQPNKKYLDRVCELACIRLRSCVIGQKLRELDQYYIGAAKGVPREVHLGQRLSLLIRSFIVWSFKHREYSGSEFSRNFRGQPVPKMMVWIIQMIGMLSYRINLPYSDISLVFNLEVKGSGDEIEEVSRIIPEISLFGKLSSVCFGKKHSGIIVTERVLSNSAPGVLSAMANFGEDTSCVMSHPVEATLHDMSFASVLGIHFHVDQSIGNFIKTSFETDDPAVCNDCADWILHSLIGDGQLVDTQVQSVKITDSLGDINEVVTTYDVNWSEGSEIRDLSPGSPSDVGGSS